MRQSYVGFLQMFRDPPDPSAEPYNLWAPVKSLATLFTDIYGTDGLIVDSLATLPGEQPHSAHFNSAFQFDFSQFSTRNFGASFEFRFSREWRFMSSVEPTYQSCSGSTFTNPFLSTNRYQIGTDILWEREF